MSYMKAENILPQEMIELIQTYVDGSYIYIPRKETNRKVWGESTQAKRETTLRNRMIYHKYQSGACVEDLAKEYFLSTKSIYRIIVQEKKIC